NLALGVPVCVIPNGVDVPERRPKPPVIGRQQRTALFLGRIYPVKGLPLLIEAWARVRPVNWQLRIAGPDEAGHRAEIQKMMAVAGLDDVVSFVGPLDDDAKRSALLDADLFVLPTHSESFGMVIAEALAHGLPVLTTTGAPWPMLPQRGCGWWVDPTVDGLTGGLRQATSLDSGMLQAMGAKGRELVIAEYRWERIAKQFVITYEDVIAFNKRFISRDQRSEMDRRRITDSKGEQTVRP